MYQNYLTTVDAVSRQLIKVNPSSVPSASQSEYDAYFAYVRRAILQVSKYIATQTNEIAFVPYYGGQKYYIQNMTFPPRGIVDNRQMRVPLYRHILEVETATWITTELTADTQYRLTNSTQANARPPYDMMLIDMAASSIPYGGWSSPAFDAALTIEGAWGYNTSPSTMFEETDALASGVNDSTASIPVADAGLFEVYDYIRIDDELMLVTAINTTTDILTVKRGVNGYTAAAHDAAADVARYIVEPDIALIATRLAALVYERKTDVGTAIQVMQTGVTVGDTPLMVRETLDRYASYGVWGVVV